MQKNKTVQSTSSVQDFIISLQDETMRKDALSIIQLMQNQTGLEPKMWGESIVGFGSYHYKYESGREGDGPNIAFSPRVSSIAIYLSANLKDRETLLEKLGKYKASKGCVHIKTLADIDKNILTKMISNHLAHIKDLYPDR